MSDELTFVAFAIIFLRKKKRFRKFDLAFFRSSRPEVLCKKGVLKNFTKFIGKHLCQSLFSNKDAALGLQLH